MRRFLLRAWLDKGVADWAKTFEDVHPGPASTARVWKATGALSVFRMRLQVMSQHRKEILTVSVFSMGAVHRSHFACRFLKCNCAARQRGGGERSLPPARSATSACVQCTFCCQPDANQGVFSYGLRSLISAPSLP